MQGFGLWVFICKYGKPKVLKNEFLKQLMDTNNR